VKASILTRETVNTVDAVDRGFPEFRVGDLIEVYQIVKEGDKEREQKFEGNVICIRKNGVSSTFTVRKIGDKNIGIERIFPFYSPNISKINKLKTGQVRRAKLFYLRDRIGKTSKIKGH
jgi:large subunit ribosomal protein L19